jgi:hypothetical protein
MSVHTGVRTSRPSPHKRHSDAERTIVYKKSLSPEFFGIAVKFQRFRCPFMRANSDLDHMVQSADTHPLSRPKRQTATSATDRDAGFPRALDGSSTAVMRVADMGTAAARSALSRSRDRVVYEAVVVPGRRFHASHVAQQRLSSSSSLSITPRAGDFERSRFAIPHGNALDDGGCPSRATRLRAVSSEFCVREHSNNPEGFEMLAASVNGKRTGSHQ